MTAFTLIDAGRETTLDVEVDGDRVLIHAEDVAVATGWTLKPQGLCRGAICVPLRDEAARADGRIDLALLAETLRRPLALDTSASAAFLGTSAIDGTEHLRSLHAADFTLPDLDGRAHSLSDHAGTKVLLVFYASW